MSKSLYCSLCQGRITAKAGAAPSGRQRYRCENGHRTTNVDERQVVEEDIFDKKVIGEKITHIRKHRHDSKIQRYIITSAQNNTPLNTKFFNSLLTYCKFIDAELIVIPVRYKNPTNLKEWARSDLWWPTEIIPYVVDKTINLNKNICVMGDIKIAATAVDPVSGLETISGIRSAIFGHAQVRMKMVATPQDKLPKMLHTSGSISNKNYSSTKAGAKGNHHHSAAAVMIECQDDLFFTRELSADSDGSFHDLDCRIDGINVERGHRIEALVTGDEHIIHTSHEVQRATYSDEDSIVACLQPRAIVRHDVLDFYSQNHHHQRNLLRKYAKINQGLHNVEEELEEVIDYIDKTTPDGILTYIVPSNHNDALTRWLNDYKPFEDVHNLRIYAKLLLDVCDEIECTGDIPDVFEIYARDKFKAAVKFLDRRHSCLIRGVDISQHGDAGANGARGSIKSFASTEYKSIIGHSHSPGIKFGCYQVGTSSKLNLEYNRGLSSWMNTHAIIYPNGKRTLIHIIDGQWRAKEE